MSRPQSRAGQRQERSLRNDQRIIDAALAVLDEEGWGGLTHSGVAKRAELNGSTVATRFPLRSALGAEVWRQRIGTAFLDRLNPLLDGIAEPSLSGPRLQRLLEPFMKPDKQLRVAGELIILAGFDPALASAIAETVGSSMTAWVTPARGVLTRAGAARNAFVISMAIGFILEARRYGSFRADFAKVFQSLARALSQPAPPTHLPAARATHLDAPVNFGTGDPAQEAALTATLDCVASLGYEGATIEAITAASGYSRTVIYSRYPAKLDLFMDATERMLNETVALNLEYQLKIEESSGPGIGEACYLRESLRPERVRSRTIMLEQVRLAARHESIRKSILESLEQFVKVYAAEEPGFTRSELRARLIVDLALSTGAAAFAQLRTDIWNLPFDSVLIPWRTT